MITAKTYFSTGFACMDTLESVSPFPVEYTLEVEGEELTFTIRSVMKDSIMYSGLPEDRDKLIVYIGPPLKEITDWIIKKYRELYSIIPNPIVLNNLLTQAHYYDNF